MDLLYSQESHRIDALSNTSHIITTDIVDYSNYEIVCSGAVSTNSGYIVNDIKFLKVGMPISINGFINSENNGSRIVEDITRRANNEFYIHSNSGTITENNESGIISANLFSEANWNFNIIVEQKIQASNKALNDYFGHSISTNNNKTIVGTYGKDTQTGAAYIFANNTEVQEIQASDGSTFDQFGWSVAIKNNIIVVGADKNDSNKGAIYIFNYNGSWTETQKIIASDDTYNSSFGYSVAIDDVIVVGANGDDESGSNAGAAYIFNYNGNEWIETQKIVSNDIEASDNFGESVAISNDIIVVGAYNEGENIEGAAYIFRLSGEVWVQEQKLQSSSMGNSYYFGNAVDIDNDIIIVGSYSDGGFSAGAVYIFRLSGEVWIEEQKLESSDIAPSDNFGWSVAIEDDIIIVGAKNETSLTGAAYMFRYNGSTWIEEQKIVATDKETNDLFGQSVSIHNDFLAIGAHQESTGFYRAGSAYFYNAISEDALPQNYPVKYNTDLNKWALYKGTKPQAYIFNNVDKNAVIFNGSIPIQFYDKDNLRYLEAGDNYYSVGGDTIAMSKYLVGTQVDENNFILKNQLIKNKCNLSVSSGGIIGKIQGSDIDGNDYFGYSVAIDNGIIIVGAFGESEGGSNAGAAYIYKYNGSSWTGEQKLLSSDIGISDRFGKSVAIENDIIVVGAYGEDTDTGAAYVFRLSGEIWAEEQKLTASNKKESDFFGWASAIDNEVIVVSARNEGINSSGSAYIFRYDGTWTEEQIIQSSDIEANDRFGCSIAIEEDVIAISSESEDTGGNDVGAVYIFRYNGAEWIEEQKIQASDKEANDYFGKDVGISNNVIVVGAYLEDTGEDGAGAAYVFRYNGTEWIEEQKLQASYVEGTAYFGVRVAIDNDIIMVGASGEDTKGSNAGAVYIFKYNGSSWVEVQKIYSNDIGDADWFGESMDMNNDMAIIGATGESEGGGNNAGAAYIYQLNN